MKNDKDTTVTPSLILLILDASYLLMKLRILFLMSVFLKENRCIINKVVLANII